MLTCDMTEVGLANTKERGNGLGRKPSLKIWKGPGFINTKRGNVAEFDGDIT